MKKLFLFTHVNGGGIGDFNKRLKEQLTRQSIDYGFKVRPTLADVRLAAKEGQTVFLVNNIRIYLYLLAIPHLRPVLILHDHKARIGSTRQERLIVFLLRVFRKAFKRVIIHNECSSLGEFDNVRNAPLPPHPPVCATPALTILFFGRIEAYKNVEFIGELAPHLPNFQFVIAGSGALRPEVACLLKQPNISLLNSFIDNHVVQLLFEAADYVFLPYRDITQTGVIGLSTSFGRPIIVSDIPGFDFVRDERFVHTVELGRIERAVDVIAALPAASSEAFAAEVEASRRYHSRTEAAWSAYVDLVVGD